MYKNRLNLLILSLVCFVGACAHKSGEEPKEKQPKTVSTSTHSEAGANEVVLYALGLLNIHYQFGGNNPDAGLDCSGMTAYIYREAVGVKLPHSAIQQSKLGLAVNKNSLAPGDLVFFNTNGKSISHVGVYIGEGKFVHAPSTNGKIKVTKLSDTYFNTRYETARRILN